MVVAVSFLVGPGKEFGGLVAFFVRRGGGRLGFSFGSGNDSGADAYDEGDDISPLALTMLPLV